MMVFDVTGGISLTQFRLSDQESLVEHLNDRDFYDRTLHLPYPYTASDAVQWLNRIEELARESNPQVNWAIRNEADDAIGGISLRLTKGIDAHRSEIGYWLARPYWGRGIMTTVVSRFAQHAFEAFGLEKITATIFAFNHASARVLEKCGFTQEGYLRKHYCKDGQFIDARAYALLRTDIVGFELSAGDT